MKRTKKVTKSATAKSTKSATRRKLDWVCHAPLPGGDSAAARKARAGRRMAVLNGLKWPKGATIVVKFMAGSPKLREMVRLSAMKWSRYASRPGPANVRFVFLSPDNPEHGDIRISFDMDGSSWSYIGTECKDIPIDEPTMNFGWLTTRSSQADVDSVVLHEFGHALGCIHEHQNPKHAIQWDRDAVIKSLSGPPNNWSLKTIQSNMFDKYEPKKLSATDVDPKSIMMYEVPVSWTLDGFTAGYNTKLSDKDVALIKRMYP